MRISAERLLDHHQSLDPVLKQMSLHFEKHSKGKSCQHCWKELDIYRYKIRQVNPILSSQKQIVCVWFIYQSATNYRCKIPDFLWAKKGFHLKNGGQFGKYNIWKKKELKLIWVATVGQSRAERDKLSFLLSLSPDGVSRPSTIFSGGSTGELSSFAQPTSPFLVSLFPSPSLSLSVYLALILSL